MKQTNKKGDNTMNIAYCRISVADNLDVLSLKHQEEKCKAYALLHGFKIDKVYSEIVSGGCEFRKRAVFQKVLLELKSGSKLVVSRLDRLSRQIIDTLQIIKDFEKSKVELCITDIGNVSTDAVSKVFITIMSALAQVERENISYRVKSAKAEMKKSHKFLGGYNEFCYYKNTDGTYSVNPKEAEIFRSIINLKNNGITLRKISEVIKNKYARKLHYSYISKILKREHNYNLLDLNEPAVSVAS